MKYKYVRKLKNIWIGQSAAKPQIGEGSTTNGDGCTRVGLQAIGNSKQ